MGFMKQSAAYEHTWEHISKFSVAGSLDSEGSVYIVILNVDHVFSPIGTSTSY